jgi:hypothetical protein
MKTTTLLIRSLFGLLLLTGALTAAPTAIDTDAYQKNLRAIRSRRAADSIKREDSVLRLNALRTPLRESAEAEIEKTDEKSGAAEGAAEDDEKNVPTIPSDDILKLLRDKGLGITGGYGQTTRSASRLMTLQIRYNIFQRDTTTFLNRKFGKQPEKQVAFGEMNKLFYFANMDAAPGEELTDMSDLTLPVSILSGIYLWAGWTGKEVTFRSEKATPVFAGLSAGFGPLEKGASTVHLDVGLAFYGNSKMPKDDIYIGFSVDLELFKKLITAF